MSERLRNAVAAWTIRGMPDNTSARLCDGSARDHAGRWQPSVPASSPRFRRERYLEALYNFTALRTELPPKAKGNVNTYAFCRRDNLTAAGGRFVHASGCRRLGVVDAVAQLSRHRLTIVGDSVWLQMWMSLWLVHHRQRLAAGPGARARGGLRGQPWPDAAAWYCAPETPAVADLLLRRLAPPALSPAHIAGAERAAERAAEGGEYRDEHGDILIIGVGIWYNLKRIRCACDPSVPGGDVDACTRKSPALAEVADGEAYRPLSKAELGEQWRAQQHDCTAPRPAKWLPAGSDPCYGGARERMCMFRQTRTHQTSNGLNQCDLARDTVRLAKHIEANRATLPRHIFAVDSLSQHFRPNSVNLTRTMLADDGRWRNVLARRLWTRHAPSVTYLNLEAITHPKPAGHLDLAHWCVDSVAFEEVASALLTGVLAEVRRAGPRAEKRA